jgi:hypothetical protein
VGGVEELCNLSIQQAVTVTRRDANLNGRFRTPELTHRGPDGKPSAERDESEKTVLKATTTVGIYARGQNAQNYEGRGTSEKPRFPVLGCETYNEPNDYYNWIEKIYDEQHAVVPLRMLMQKHENWEAPLLLGTPNSP